MKIGLPPHESIRGGGEGRLTIRVARTGERGGWKTRAFAAFRLFAPSAGQTSAAGSATPPPSLGLFRGLGYLVRVILDQTRHIQIGLAGRSVLDQGDLLGGVRRRLALSLGSYRSGLWGRFRRRLLRGRS